jgi:hypothetical protein
LKHNGYFCDWQTLAEVSPTKHWEATGQSGDAQPPIPAFATGRNLAQRIDASRSIPSLPRDAAVLHRRKSDRETPVFEGFCETVSGESVSQSPLIDRAFSTFRGQNPPFEPRPSPKWDFIAGKTCSANGPDRDIKRLLQVRQTRAPHLLTSTRAENCSPPECRLRAIPPDEGIVGHHVANVRLRCR